MTYNQTIALFDNIAAAHKQIKTFGHGEAWEINGIVKPGIIYPIMWIMPIDSQTQDQVKIRTFTLFVFGQVKKDKSNETEILSDCEQIIDDVIKLLRNESDEYELIGDPVAVPFKEEFADWSAGWRADIQFQTQFANNPCDVPSEDIEPIGGQKVYIKDQDGNIIAILNPGSEYFVTILQAIKDTIDNNEFTIIENLT